MKPPRNVHLVPSTSPMDVRRGLVTVEVVYSTSVLVTISEESFRNKPLVDTLIGDATTQLFRNIEEEIKEYKK